MGAALPMVDVLYSVADPDKWHVKCIGSKGMGKVLDESPWGYDASQPALCGIW